MMKSAVQIHTVNPVSPKSGNGIDGGQKCLAAGDSNDNTEKQDVIVKDDVPVAGNAGDIPLPPNSLTSQDADDIPMPPVKNEEVTRVQQTGLNKTIQDANSGTKKSPVNKQLVSKDESGDGGRESVSFVFTKKAAPSITMVSAFSMEEDTQERKDILGSCSKLDMLKSSSAKATEGKRSFDFVKIMNKEETKELDWPAAMIKETSTQPTISYSCNPLSFDFSLLLKHGIAYDKLPPSTENTCPTAQKPISEIETDKIDTKIQMRTEVETEDIQKETATLLEEIKEEVVFKEQVKKKKHKRKKSKVGESVQVEEVTGKPRKQKKKKRKRKHKKNEDGTVSIKKKHKKKIKGGDHLIGTEKESKSSKHSKKRKRKHKRSSKGDIDTNTENAGGSSSKRKKSKSKKLKSEKEEIEKMSSSDNESEMNSKATRRKNSRRKKHSQSIQKPEEISHPDNVKPKSAVETKETRTTTNNDTTSVVNTGIETVTPTLTSPTKYTTITPKQIVSPADNIKKIVRESCEFHSNQDSKLSQRKRNMSSSGGEELTPSKQRKTPNHEKHLTKPEDTWSKMEGLYEAKLVEESKAKWDTSESDDDDHKESNLGVENNQSCSKSRRSDSSAYTYSSDSDRYSRSASRHRSRSRSFTRSISRSRSGSHSCSQSYDSYHSRYHSSSRSRSRSCSRSRWRGRRGRGRRSYSRSRSSSYSSRDSSYSRSRSRSYEWSKKYSSSRSTSRSRNGLSKSTLITNSPLNTKTVTNETTGNEKSPEVDPGEIPLPKSEQNECNEDGGKTVDDIPLPPSGDKKASSEPQIPNVTGSLKAVFAPPPPPPLQMENEVNPQHDGSYHEQGYSHYDGNYTDGPMMRGPPPFGPRYGPPPRMFSSGPAMGPHGPRGGPPSRQMIPHGPRQGFRGPPPMQGRHPGLPGMMGPRVLRGPVRPGHGPSMRGGPMPPFNRMMPPPPHMNNGRPPFQNNRMPPFIGPRMPDPDVKSKNSPPPLPPPRSPSPQPPPPPKKEEKPEVEAMQPIFIPPEQAEQYRKLQKQAQKHAKKLRRQELKEKGEEISEDEEDEEEEENKMETEEQQIMEAEMAASAAAEEDTQSSLIALPTAQSPLLQQQTILVPQQLPTQLSFSPSGQLSFSPSGQLSITPSGQLIAGQPQLILPHSLPSGAVPVQAGAPFIALPHTSLSSTLSPALSNQLSLSNSLSVGGHTPGIMSSALQNQLIAQSQLPVQNSLLPGVPTVQGLSSIGGLPTVPGLPGLHGISGLQNIQGLHGVQSIHGIQGLPGIHSMPGVQHLPQLISPVAHSQGQVILIPRLHRPM